jgi:peptide deformylase
MAILPIRRYPDPILRSPAPEVRNLTPAAERLIQDMIDTMYASPATIGLAAPQVGKSMRVIVIDVTPRERRNGLLVLINPKITHQDSERVTREGCLSLPDYTANVRRWNQVVVKALSRNWQPLELKTEGIEAICIQHEVDHVDGLLFVDRVDSLKTDIFRRRRYQQERSEGREK